MSLLAPLLDLQACDLQADRLRARRAALPEREALRLADVAAEALEAAHARLVERRRALADAEHDLGDEVAVVAARAKAVEQTLYSGSVRIPKELTALQAEIRLFRVQQSEIEGRELGVLEEIERAEAEIAENRANRSSIDVEKASLESSLAVAEGAIDSEHATLEGQRAGLLEAIPSDIRVTYERLRSRERLVGRAAAALVDGGCEGCHMKLPVLEYNRMKSKPEDALLLCVHCGRILVR